jgi:hypothetical protein
MQMRKLLKMKAEKDEWYRHWISTTVLEPQILA